MTAPAAGAGGVDREAIRRDLRCECGHRAVDHQDGGTGRCTEDNDRDWYCPCQSFTVADDTIPALLDALAAAEQRADTAEAESAERDHRAYEHGISIGRALMMGRVERAKQRADTLAAAAADEVRYRIRAEAAECEAAGIRLGSGLMDSVTVVSLLRRMADSVADRVAALSSRPVQPETTDALPALWASIEIAKADRPKRYDQCDETCTVDCGHCKGAGRPVQPDTERSET